MEAANVETIFESWDSSMPWRTSAKHYEYQIDKKNDDRYKCFTKNMKGHKRAPRVSFPPIIRMGMHPRMTRDSCQHEKREMINP
jgi:hypothetical protein